MIIGAGAAGMTAAIACRRNGGEARIAERLAKSGKKLLATGGGRCNLLNQRLDPAAYNAAARCLVAPVLEVNGRDALLAFLGSLGLEMTAEGDRLFPATNQAASVVRAFELELCRLGVAVDYNCEAASISPGKDGFCVRFSNGSEVACGSVVIAGGGKSYPALGSNGSCMRIARQLGHRIVEPVPSCVAVCCQDKLCHHLQGQKITAAVSCVIDGKLSGPVNGEVLFTQYGLSGTAVLDVSTRISLALYREKKKDIALAVDCVPFMDKETLAAKIGDRLGSGMAVDDMLTGILPNKFSHALGDLLRSRNAAKIAGVLKDRRFAVTGTRGWNEAEFTSGGVAAEEVDPVTLESRIVPGIYFCGEVLDVDGPRGGFNLAWAWASGLSVGNAIARREGRCST